MKRIAWVFVTVIALGIPNVSWADDDNGSETRISVAFSGNAENDQQAMETLRQAAGTAPSVGFSIPIEMQNTAVEKEAMSLINQNLEHMRQTAIAKAEREGYVLNMDGQKYGRPDVLEKERYRESMTYVNEDGIDTTYGDAKGNMITREEYIQNSQEIAESMIAGSRKWLEEVRTTISDKALLAEVERGAKEFEDSIRRNADEGIAKVMKARKKSDFAIPSSWKSEKINVYNKAKDLGITLFENEGESPKDELVKTDEVKKEEPKPAPTAPQVLISTENRKITVVEDKPRVLVS